MHRLLAAGIQADETFPDLLNKRILHGICNNLNYRNRMAQHAGRASVDLHTQVMKNEESLFRCFDYTFSHCLFLVIQIFFKNSLIDEDGYVFAVRKNALQILLPRYGLETTLFLRDKEGKSVGEFNEEVLLN